MEPGDNKLRPDDVDTQIENLAQYTQDGIPDNHQSAQLVQRLQQHYASERQKVVLARAWQSIAQKYEDGMPSSFGVEHSQENPIKKKDSGQYHMEYQEKQIPLAQTRRRKFPRWGTLLAVAVLALVIGSTTVILSHAAQQHGSPASGGSTTPICIKPTPPPITSATPIVVNCTTKQTGPRPTPAQTSPVPTATPKP
jgi:hypothetical protein